MNESSLNLTIAMMLPQHDKEKYSQFSSPFGFGALTQIAVVSQTHLFHIFSLRKTHSYIIIRRKMKRCFYLDPKPCIYSLFFLRVSDSKILTRDCTAIFFPLFWKIKMKYNQRKCWRAFEKHLIKMNTMYLVEL